MQNGDIIGMVFCKLIQRAMVGQALVYFDDFAAERPRTGLEWRAKIAQFLDGGATRGAIGADQLF